jgi:hypothetical protein
VREPLRDVDAAVVVSAQFHADVLKIGWRLRPQVHDDVEDGAPARPHELRLGRWRKLEVHAAERPFSAIEPDVGLCDDGFQAVLGKLLLAKRAREESPVVVSPLEVDDEGAFELCLCENHDSQGQQTSRHSVALGRPPSCVQRITYLTDI